VEVKPQVCIIYPFVMLSSLFHFVAWIYILWGCLWTDIMSAKSLEIFGRSSMGVVGLICN
jgi:D-alanyl-lipoteichoic acid acyltransferase DltB (MBOAT superfamily)